jgi:hypothetical protein
MKDESKNADVGKKGGGVTPEFLLLYLQQITRVYLVLHSRQLAKIESKQNGFRRTLARMESKLDRISSVLAEEFAGAIDFDAVVEGVTIKGALEMQITDSQQVVLTIRPKNKAGKPASVEPGSVAWTGPAFVAITPSDDGLSATVVAQGIGDDQISVSADADLGAGVVTISGTLPLTVVASQAVSLTIEAGGPTEQVEAGPEPNPA